MDRGRRGAGSATAPDPAGRRVILRAAAALALSGRYAAMGRQAAAGLRAWADARGAALRLEDDRSRARPSRPRLLASLAPRRRHRLRPLRQRAGPRGRRAMAGRPEVVWNHGGGGVPRTGARLVDVLGPGRALLARAARGARGARGGPRDGRRGAVPGRLRRRGRRRRARGAGRRRRAPARPVLDLDPADPAAARGPPGPRGARWVVGGGRAEDDLALGRALARVGAARRARRVRRRPGRRRARRPGVAGWIGPAQWAPGGPPPPVALPPGVDYPAAQAARGRAARRAGRRAAGSLEPDAIWDAARALRTRTFLGPFAVDDGGPPDRPLAAHRASGEAGAPGCGGRCCGPQPEPALSRGRLEAIRPLAGA